MASRRVIKAVLENFLGTYVSRYSDFGGYWLFGFLVEDVVDDIKIDLSQEIPDTSLHSPLVLARSLAVVKFDDQRRKARLAPSQIRSAQLTIQRMSGPETGSINGHSSSGFKVRFLAEAVMFDGRRYKKERIVFVAPHDPRVEFRSVSIG